MEIKKILIYGSAHLTKVTCDLLENHYELVDIFPLRIQSLVLK